MTAVVAIYGTGLVLCLLAGLVAGAVLDLHGRWATVWTLPLGAGLVIATLWWLGYFLDARAATPVLLALLAAGLATAVALRLLRAPRPGDGADPPARGARSVLAAVTPRVPDAIVLGIATVAGLVFLTPLLRAGFPSTIAYSNNDGWSYVGIIEWLQTHAYGPRALADPEHPTTFAPYAQLRDGFAVGFEFLSSVTATLLGREAYEMVNPMSAIGVAIAACGWGALWTAVTGRLSHLHAALVSLGVASPLFLLPFAENYTPQFMAMCFWPTAAAATVHLARRPSVARAAIAAVAAAAVIGVYPPLAPWLVPTLMLAALAGGGWPRTLRGWRDLRAHLPRLRRALLVLAGLAAALLVIAPIQLRHTLRWFTVHTAEAGIPFPRVPLDAYLVFSTGTSPIFSYITGSPVAWSVTVAAALVVPVYILGLLLPVRPGELAKRAVLLVTGGAVIATTAVLVAFVRTDPLGYGIYKALITGGAFLAGLLVLSLIPLEPGPRSAPRFAGIAVLVGVWIPVSAGVLQLSATGGAGFRAADIQLGRELDRLPERSDVLVEGAAEEPGSFQVRMMGAYFGADYADQDMEGLGSSSSYITPGGQPQWRPDEAWTYVVTVRTDPAPFGAGRTRLWTNGRYTLWRAPLLDATPFGGTWYPQERDAAGVYQWTSGPVQIVVSNRSRVARRAVLVFRAGSYASDRTVVVGAEGAPARAVRVRGDAPMRPVRVPVQIPAGGVTPVLITPEPGAEPAPPGDPRTLSLRIADVRVRPA